MAKGIQDFQVKDFIGKLYINKSNKS